MAIGFDFFWNLEAKVLGFEILNFGVLSSYCGSGEGDRLFIVTFDFLSSDGLYPLVTVLWLLSRAAGGETLDESLVAFTFFTFGDRSGEGGFRLATRGGLILSRLGDLRLIAPSLLLLFASGPDRSATLGQYICESSPLPTRPRLLRFFALWFGEPFLFSCWVYDRY